MENWDYFKKTIMLIRGKICEKMNVKVKGMLLNGGVKHWVLSFKRRKIL